MQQQTLKKQIVIEGVGLHSGATSVLTLKPAPVDSGVIFTRQGQNIAAKYFNVVDTRNCTAIGANGVTVSTIEHLMAALYAAGVDNVEIECSALELPILNGGAREFLDSLLNVGVAAQEKKRHYLKVLKPVCFEDEKGAKVQLLPNGGKDLHIHFEIEFPSKIVGHQTFDGVITPEVFSTQIAPCRTFCEKQQIDYLRSIGLIKGGSLDNAVVLDGDHILNPGGFKVENECVNHKVLDAVGDLYTSGFRILADSVCSKSGHYHNNELLKKLFADETNFEIV